MPPFTSGIISVGKAIGVLGSSAFDLGSENNSNNPKAKSLITTETDEANPNTTDALAKNEANAAFEKAKGAA